MTEENEINLEQYGRWSVYVPEDVEEADVVLYIRPGGKDIPPGYQTMFEEQSDKIIIYGTLEDGFKIEEVPSVIREVTNEKNISVGVIDVNTHSRSDKYAVLVTNELSDNGYTVAHATILDGNSTLKYMDMQTTGKGLTNADWQKFASTGAKLNVFTRGADGNYELEQRRLSGAVRNGVPVTYTLCSFDGNKDWGEKHAAVPRDLIAGNLMSIYDGTRDDFSFNDVDNPKTANINGFEWSNTYDYDKKAWVKIYDKTLNGSDYSSLTNYLSDDSSIYHTNKTSTLPTTYTLTDDKYDKNNPTASFVEMLKNSFNEKIIDLPESENLVVYRGELSAFLNSTMLASLPTDATDASNLINLINGFISNNVLKSETWNITYEKLGLYNKKLSERIQTANELGEILRSTISALIACMSEYDKIDISDLDELELLIVEIDKQIATLYTKLNKLEEYTDEKGNRGTREIKDEGVQNQINALQEQRDEAEKYVNAIKNLQQTYDSVRPQLENALAKVNAFSGSVANITPSPVYTYVA